jgi:hypothetical protein
MNRLRAALLRWLQVDAMIHAAVDAERLRSSVSEAEIADRLASFAIAVDETHGKLAGALRAAVNQLNHNTTTLQRWANESESLRHIEERNARKQGKLEVVNGNGSARIIGLDSAS